MNTIDQYGHGLGRVTSPPDERDGAYLARSRFPVATPQRKRRQWYTGNTRHFDQGNIGQCTAYSAAHLLVAGPVTQRPYTYTGGEPPINTVAMYCRAQEIDKANHGWTDPTFCQDRSRPGGVGDWGATMRGAAQALREKGFIQNFWWLRTVDEIVAYLINVGPVWMGTKWTADMSIPDGEHFIRPTGSNQGGHAYILDQCELGPEYVWILNSWSKRWGHLGRAKLRLDDLESLLQNRGEALAVSEIRLQP